MAKEEKYKEQVASHGIFKVISLIAKVVNHLSMYLLANGISSFIKCLFKSHFFLLMSFSY